MDYRFTVEEFDRNVSKSYLTEIGPKRLRALHGAAYTNFIHTLDISDARAVYQAVANALYSGILIGLDIVEDRASSAEELLPGFRTILVEDARIGMTIFLDHEWTLIEKIAQHEDHFLFGLLDAAGEREEKGFFEGDKIVVGIPSSEKKEGERSTSSEAELYIIKAEKVEAGMVVILPGGAAVVEAVHHATNSIHLTLRHDESFRETVYYGYGAFIVAQRTVVEDPRGMTLQQAFKYVLRNRKPCYRFVEHLADEPLSLWVRLTVISGSSPENTCFILDSGFFDQFDRTWDGAGWDRYDLTQADVDATDWTTEPPEEEGA